MLGRSKADSEVLRSGASGDYGLSSSLCGDVGVVGSVEVIFGDNMRVGLSVLCFQSMVRGFRGSGSAGPTMHGGWVQSLDDSRKTKQFDGDRAKRRRSKGDSGLPLAFIYRIVFGTRWRRHSVMPEQDGMRFYHAERDRTDISACGKL